MDLLRPEENMQMRVDEKNMQIRMDVEDSLESPHNLELPQQNYYSY